MAPFRAFSTLSWKTAPVILSRYNGKPAMQLQGAPGQGLSTGDAMNAITEMHGKLPPGTGLEWTGLSYEERLSGGQRSEEHTSELQSLMRISYAVFCLKKKKKKQEHITIPKVHTQYKNHTNHQTYRV